MGFINTLPPPFDTISIERKTTTYNEYNQPTGETWAESENVQGKIILGTMSVIVSDDKFSPAVAATALIDPEDLVGEIVGSDRIVADGIVYSIIYIDNIEGVSIEIPLKLWE